MHEFQVWAPKAQSVTVRVDGQDFPMRKEGSGYWYARAKGSDYCFFVDGDSLALPDPRSPWQPEGVHGPSRLVDHSAFRWTDAHFQPRPLKSGIIYEMHVGTFTPAGTFDSAIERLDHLMELGVTHVELMPVNHFSGNWGWGYDGVDLYAPHEAYGGPDGLKRLVDACHARGLAVLLDVVYNHLGPAGNYLSRFGPYFSDHYKTPWGDAVNLDDAYSQEVRRFFIDNALMWMRDYHFDGLRIDAVHALIDNSAYHFLEQLAEETSHLEAQVGRHLMLIAESDLNDPRVVRSRDLGGYGIDAQWSDDFHHALHSVVAGEQSGYYEDFGSIAQLAKAMKDVFVYDGAYSGFRERPHGRSASNIPSERFLAYIQNHDQIGNRAAGERISQLAGIRKAKIAAGLVLLSPYTPMLFQGEEWAASTPFQYFTQHEDLELGKAVSEGRRSEFVAFGWDPANVPDPQDPATFERSKLKWEEASTQPHAEVLDWYKQLIALRRSSTWFSDGDRRHLEVQFDENDGWFVMRRGRMTVACNFSSQSRCVPVEGASRVQIASEAGAEITDCGVRLPGESMAVLERG